MKRTIIIILLAVFFQTLTFSQQAPKREVRAVWLTTAWALDWPSVRVPAPVFAPDGVTITNEAARATARTQQQNQLRAIIDRMEAANFNTIYFQVRPMADAFFRSSFEPWSAWISSVRGADPGWSPLGWLIEEAHARGMEVHAWMNPYRYTTSPGFFGTHPLDYDQQHPEWLMDYGHSGTTHPRILNPGRPEVRQRIVDIVEEILLNYNVDGIILDDYFYVSGTTDAMDQREFDLYPVFIDGRRVTNRAEWRREQINMMVADVQQIILETAPWVQWGISPAGVAMGSNISQAIRDAHGLRRPCPGSDWQFASLHSDPVMWLRRGTIDYISPQIYWGHTHSTNPYQGITNWWAEVSNQFGRHFFSSNTATMSGITEAATAAEMVRQVQTNRTEDRNDAPGFVLFRDGTGHARGVYTALRNNVFQNPALTASFGWKPAPMQGLVESMVVSGRNLTWTYTSRDERTGVRFAVYAIPNANRNDPDVFTSSRFLLGMTWTNSFTLPTNVSPTTHKIAVAVFDRFGNLFPARVLGEALTSLATPQLISPTQNATDVAVPLTFIWTKSGADFYVLEIAEDMYFERPIASREIAATIDAGTIMNFNTLNRIGNLRANTPYFWRVRAIKANAEVAVSEVRTFNNPNNVIDDSIEIITPADGATNVSLTPEFTWISNLEITACTVNPYGWKNKSDMFEAFKKDIDGGTANAAWLTLAEYHAFTGSDFFTMSPPADRGPGLGTSALGARLTEANLTYLFNNHPKWHWLRDYVMSVATSLVLPVGSTTANQQAWRSNMGAFWMERNMPFFPQSTGNWSVAGSPEAFVPAWGYCFDDGSANVELIFTLEISASSSFSTIVYSMNTAETSAIVSSDVLEYATTYYARVITVHAGRQISSKTISFTTEAAPITVPVPTIISPTDGDIIFGTEIEIVWEGEHATGFRTYLSTHILFEEHATQVKHHAAHYTRVTHTDLEPGTYYIRMRALTATGETAATQTIMIELMGDTADIPEIKTNDIVYIYQSTTGVSHLVINQTNVSSATISVFSIMGRMLYSQNHSLNAGITTIPLEMLQHARGVYLVQVVVGETIQTHKVIR